jgi:hypothetical protein
MSIGRHDDARKLFDRLLAVRNDLGLLAEEYDPRARRLIGNYPQAFSHVGLINTAFNLTRWAKPKDQRATTDGGVPAPATADEQPKPAQGPGRPKPGPRPGAENVEPDLRRRRREPSSAAR